MTSDPTATTAFPQLGRYQVLRKLGEGGMGAVFLALDTQLDRQVAIKVLPEQSVNNPDSLGRFQREARALAKLSHPGIIQAHDNGSHGDHHFLVMEFVDGKSLADLLAEKGTLSPTRVADYGHQVALALQHAHAKGLIHRDLKPSNLLVTSDGQVKILDLGLARFLQDNVGDPSKTREGVGMGTPDYAAPEQFRDAHAVDVRADIYALGCTLYHLLTGQVPFPGTSLAEKYDAHLVKELPPIEERCADAPAGLALVVRKMMAKKPADRFQTAQEVADALAPFIATSSRSFQVFKQTATWHQGQLMTTAIQPIRRRRLGMWALASCAALLLLAASAWMGAKFLGPAPASIAANGEKPGDKDKGQPGEEVKNDAWLDPNVLTVSKDPKDGGSFRSISAALEQVNAGQTIRVLDGSDYNEFLRITRRNDMAGITLEAVAGATLALEKAPEKSVMVEIAAPDVTLRGFRLRANQTPRSTLIGVRGGCPGLSLERLQLVGTGSPNTNGMEFYGAPSHVAGQAPVVIRDCDFRGFNMALFLGSSPGSCYYGMAVRDCLFKDCLVGVASEGGAQAVQVVGNRFRDMSITAVQLAFASPESDILIANNTFFAGATAFRLMGISLKANVSFQNNIILAAESLDMVALDAVKADESRGPGDGVAVSAAYHIGYNWREGKDWGPGKGWIPAVAEKRNVLAATINGVNRDPKSPDFLRPKAESPLATDGAGKDYPSLPPYVGAVPPEGVEAWDWDRTWLAPPGTTKLLTVSKAEKDGGTYRTINTALDKAKPWDTIRVLDDATYEESISFTDKHVGVCLEAVMGATLFCPETERRMIMIRDVSDLTVRGFTLRAQKKGNAAESAFVRVSGKCSGLRLSKLQMEPADATVGMSLDSITAGVGEPPVVVSQCTFRPQGARGGIAFTIRGSPAVVTQGIRLADNHVSNCTIGIALLGSVANVHVVGNIVWDCRESGILVQDLPEAATGLLVANNTAFACANPLRIWDNKPYPTHAKNQVTITNNILFEAEHSDMGYILCPDRANTAVVTGDGKALLEAWRWSHNRRDLSGNVPMFAVPFGSKDAKLQVSELMGHEAAYPNRVRPLKDSSLAKDGAGRDDPSLPVYIGALPPDGVAPWDWNRTWRARAPRRSQPPESKEIDKSDK